MPAEKEHAKGILEAFDLLTSAKQDPPAGRAFFDCWMRRSASLARHQAHSCGFTFEMMLARWFSAKMTLARWLSHNIIVKYHLISPLLWASERMLRHLQPMDMFWVYKAGCIHSTIHQTNNSGTVPPYKGLIRMNNSIFQHILLRLLKSKYFSQI